MIDNYITSMCSECERLTVEITADLLGPGTFRSAMFALKFIVNYIDILCINSSPYRSALASYAHAEVSAIADSGAQSDLWSLADFLACVFSRDDLVPVSLGLSAANRSPILIEGAFYVSSSVQAMYLSYESMLNLGILSNNFSSVDNAGRPSEMGQTSAPDQVSDAPSELPPINATRSINGGCNASRTSCDATCSCPQRGVAPPRPSELPFPCTPENNGRM